LCYFQQTPKGLVKLLGPYALVVNLIRKQGGPLGVVFLVGFAINSSYAGRESAILFK